MGSVVVEDDVDGFARKDLSVDHVKSKRKRRLTSCTGCTNGDDTLRSGTLHHSSYTYGQWCSPRTRSDALLFLRLSWLVALVEGPCAFQHHPQSIWASGSSFIIRNLPIFFYLHASMSHNGYQVYQNEPLSENLRLPALVLMSALGYEETSLQALISVRFALDSRH